MLAIHIDSGRTEWIIKYARRMLSEGRTQEDVMNALVLHGAQRGESFNAVVAASILNFHGLKR